MNERERYWSLCCMRFTACRCKLFSQIYDCLSIYPFLTCPIMSHYTVSEFLSLTDTTMMETWSAKCRASASSTNLFVTWELWLATAPLSSTAWWRSASRRNWPGCSCMASGNPSAQLPWQRPQDSQSPQSRWPLLPHWRRTAEWEGLCEIWWDEKGKAKHGQRLWAGQVHLWMGVCVCLCIYKNMC